MNIKSTIPAGLLQIKHRDCTIRLLCQSISIVIHCNKILTVVGVRMCHARRFQKHTDFGNSRPYIKLLHFLNIFISVIPSSPKLNMAPHTKTFTQTYKINQHIYIYL
jgi:hypothetical protein